LADSRKTQFSTEYVTAVAHFYRGEMARSNTWRRRLDVTTNWAIVTTAAFLSFGFGSERIPHFVIILATIFVLFFLIIETRRYKYFDLWRWRVALMKNFYDIANWRRMNRNLCYPTEVQNQKNPNIIPS